MGWDSSRTVPWQRLMREWVVYIGIMAVILLVFFRDGGVVGAMAGLMVSGPLYLGFGYVMAKFGYQRKSLKEMKTARAEPRRKKSENADDPPTRSRPPATSRTSTGINRPKAKKRR
jgi:hypothetical protein